MKRSSLADYYSLTKSGLVFGNLITVIAGFAIAASSRGGIRITLLIETLAGIALVMASGCVFNNVIDRDIDIRMERTKHRALVEGRISPRGAFAFGTVLGIAGFAILVFLTTPFATAAAAGGFVIYVFAYSMWGKRSTVYGTLIGAVAGATPPIVGYAAAGGGADAAAGILFIMLITWQMAHFYSIAVRRGHEYAAAGVPAAPVKYGAARAKVSILIYVIEFTAASALLVLYGYEGWAYLAVSLVLCVAWFALAVSGFGIKDDTQNTAWAKRMFFVSLAVMVFVFAAAAVLA